MRVALPDCARPASLKESSELGKTPGGNMSEILPPGSSQYVSRSSKKKFLLWAVLFAAVLAGTLLLKPWNNNRSLLRHSFLSGDPVRGASLFGDLGCNACHALFGIGPKIGPDLAATPANSWNPVQAVAEMWSHGPQMWERMKDAQLGFPRVSEQNMVDLLAYLYLIRYVDEPGDPGEGKLLFQSKHCADCHSFSDESAHVGPDLSRLKPDTPIMWAQRMWNHGERMGSLMAEKNITWPSFQGREMIDLLAYLQSSSSGNRRQSDLFPADPVRGKLLFAERGCKSCHAVNGEGGNVGPDLGNLHKSAPSITQFAGLMWNHSPQMLSQMQKQSIARPLFAGREMADVIAYLYVVRYLEPEGSDDSGKEIFRAKHCADCHGTDGHGGRGGPNLARRPEGYNSPQMAYTVWSHGPQMYRKMKENNIPWPTLSEQELMDLMSFLNSL